LSRIYRNSARVVANSTGLRDLFLKTYPDLDPRVIPNGIDTEEFSPRPHDAAQPVQLICMARLIPRKGIELLIRACAELKRKGLDFRCHIVGEGPEEEHLKTLAAERNLLAAVLFHGRLERAAVAQLLPQCDIFVLPSYAEGMSNAALEAMACGLPLVLSDTGGTRELVDGNGAIFPVGDQEILNQILVELVRNRELRRALGERSRRNAMNFTWRRVAEQYRALYGEILGESKS
jgi:glycosyltransferase involved in cell wall biosynthesis